MQAATPPNKAIGETLNPGVMVTERFCVNEIHMAGEVRAKHTLGVRRSVLAVRTSRSYWIS